MSDEDLAPEGLIVAKEGGQIAVRGLDRLLEHMGDPPLESRHSPPVRVVCAAVAEPPPVGLSGIGVRLAAEQVFGLRGLRRLAPVLQP